MVPRAYHKKLAGYSPGRIRNFERLIIDESSYGFCARTVMLSKDLYLCASLIQVLYWLEYSGGIITVIFVKN